MKNVHVLPTEKPSRLVLETVNDSLFLTTTTDFGTNIMKFQNIYITSDEVIKEGDWILWEGEVVIAIDTSYWDAKKIILTTDQELIEDGVQDIQDIDDDFLHWFIKNPSCEEVKFYKDLFQVNQNNPVLKGSTALVRGYKIIIPKKEQKQHLIDIMNQETLEEVVENTFGLVDPILGKSDYRIGFESGLIKGAKWQAQRMYSEEDLSDAFFVGRKTTLSYLEWFEQFKKQ